MIIFLQALHKNILPPNVPSPAAFGAAGGIIASQIVATLRTETLADRSWQPFAIWAWHRDIYGPLGPAFEANSPLFSVLSSGEAHTETQDEGCRRRVQCHDNDHDRKPHHHFRVKTGNDVVRHASYQRTNQARHDRRDHIGPNA